MDADDCFYDELSSFVSSPNDYGMIHHDFDEIISSTVSHLDSSLDFNALLPLDRETTLQSDNFFSDLFPITADSHNDLELSFNNLSAFSMQCMSADRTSSTSSIVAPQSLGDEILSRNHQLEHSQNRDTPSPTESCGSFSGSSTSGVHSDSSDAWQNRPREQINGEASILGPPQFPMPLIQNYTIKNDDSIQKCKLTASGLNDDLIKSSAPPTVRKVPVETTVCMPVKMVSNLSLKSEVSSLGKLPLINHPAESVNKTKTIFLSSNDYKALMLKLNFNGSKGAQINGSVKSQIPKIVMKAANGKLQGQQNVLQATHLLSNHKPSNLLNSQHQVSVSTFNHDTSTKVSEPSSYICRGMIDEKIYKKQQRMIKNRESASLSRKKKKEYVVSLETRINNLQKENYTLKDENVTLRNQLVALAKTCECRKGSVCEFVLHSLSSTSRPEQHVKIAPKPASKSFKQRLNAATVKKNVAVLFAMAFMVTLNAGNFQTYLSNQNLDSDNSVAVSESNANEPIPIGRRLLWVDSEEEYNEKLNRSNRQSEELAMPPLHFLRPSSRSRNATKNDQLNSTAASGINNANDPPPLTYPSLSKCNGVCASSNSSDNQSEYSRLAINLQKLNYVRGYLNLSMHKELHFDEDNGFKFATDYLELPDLQRQTSNLGKRKTYVGYNEHLSDVGHKQRKLNTENHNKITFSNATRSTNLLKGIKRQDDTLYVISFNTEHILLSPSTDNKSERPKMSLLLPTAEPSHNGDIMMMQVDCEVFNTKEFELKSHMIPSRLRTNVTKWKMQPKHASNTKNKTQDQLQERSVKHEIPRVRTYFMVGPKNQAAAALSQEKPRLVQFNKGMANSSKVITADRNSSLQG